MVKRIKSHKAKWERRNVAMSTLGTASYLDGSDKKEYVRLSKEKNPFMAEQYGDLHDKVLHYFQSKCPSATVRYKDHNAALPGFHIFDCNKVFAMPVASVHRDMQWNRLTYHKNEDIDEENTLSFTLALELPEGGGGLYTFEDAPNSLLIPRPLSHSMSRKTHIEYKVGWMVTHNGQTSHMIAPCKESKKFRITLQGHGVYEKNANTWWLYW
jgi:hypothetical protein